MTNLEFSVARSSRLGELREQYRTTLFDDVVPWWERNSFDRERGGYYSCLGRNGRPWSTDKYVWPTGRESWMFAHLYNHHQQKPAWLDAARMGTEFLLKYAFRPDGGMYFRLTRDGRPLSKVLSTYTEVFAAIALAEVSRASGDEALWDRAIAVYDNLVPRLGQASDTAMLGYPINANFHLHAHDMCRITVAWVFNEVRPSRRFEDDLDLSVTSVVQRHWKPDLRALLENVAMDGSPMLDLQEGRMFHCGHAIEIAWMLLEVARQRTDPELVHTSTEIILASLEHGWDQQFGGLRYLTNIDWSPTHEIGANLKLWWPHCEALYAVLLAWSLTGREDLWQWYEKIHDYSFGNFSDPEYGEWYGYLDRDGTPASTAKANGWKGFFHLPRVLFRCYQLLDQLLAGRPNEKSRALAMPARRQ